MKSITCGPNKQCKYTWLLRRRCRVLDRMWAEFLAVEMVGRQKSKPLCTNYYLLFNVHISKSTGKKTHAQRRHTT